MQMHVLYAGMFYTIELELIDGTLIWDIFILKRWSCLRLSDSRCHQ